MLSTFRFERLTTELGSDTIPDEYRSSTSKLVKFPIVSGKLWSLYQHLRPNWWDVNDGLNCRPKYESAIDLQEYLLVISEYRSTLEVAYRRFAENLVVVM
jgi:hypothetical protein